MREVNSLTSFSEENFFLKNSLYNYVGIMRGNIATVVKF